MLRAAAVLLAAFVGLCAAMKYLVLPARLDPDAALLAELAEAEFQDDAPPKGGGWPQWRGPRRDGVAGQEADLGRMKLAWKVPGGEGYSSFAVGGGRAYTMLDREGKERVVCLDLATGAEKWAHEHAPRKTFPYGGPRSTPALDGTRLYAVTSDGVLLCLDAEKGGVAWETDTEAVLPKWGLACSPLVAEGLVLVARGGKGRCLAAFGAKDGKERWTCGDDEAGYSSPILAEIGGVRQAVFFTGSKVQGAGLDGTLLWEHPWRTEFEVNAATPLHVRATNGKAALDYVLVSSGYSKGSALVKVSRRGGGWEARAAWTTNGLCCHFASPVRVGGHVYGLDETRGLTCLDLRTGEPLWRQKGFQKGSVLRAGKHVVAQMERGDIVLVEPSPEGYEEKARLAVRGDLRSWAMPVLAEGMLLARDRRHVFAFKAR
ncbi:MAG: PQQ-like beta-propeller repeat protein [Gemmataceae bacterium]|nr:PQQ-like beta-propeller repeat protein [Gemmataceae bacterium]